MCVGVSNLGSLQFPTLTLPRKRGRKLICLVGTENVNKWFAGGDQAYVLVGAAMVLLMAWALRMQACLNHFDLE